MISRRSLSLAFALSSLLAACGGGDDTSTTTSGSTTATGGAGGSGGSGGSGGTTTTSTSSTSGTTSTSSTTSTTTTTTSATGACPRVPGPADGPRKVLVSHPFTTSGGKSEAWEVLDLDAAGALSRPGVTLQMGRAYLGKAVFTPDGKVAIAPQDDGTLGVVRFDGGAPTVVHAKFQGPFYAGAVIMEPAGDSALVLDSEWANIGGGIYRVAIGCDGTLTDAGQVTPAKLPYQLAPLHKSPGLALLAGADVLGSLATDNAFLLDLGGATPSLVGGAPAFPDTDAIVSSVSVTRDDAFAILTDNGLFAGDRVAVVSVSPTGLAARQVLGPIKDPIWSLTSPFDNSAVVVSGEGNGVYKLAFDASKPSAPYTLAGAVTYVGIKPQLPGAAVLLERGALTGRFLLSELSGVRQMRFEPSGGVTDLGLFDLGSGNESTVGAIGVQP